MYDLISFGFDYVMPNVHEIYGKSLWKGAYIYFVKKKLPTFPSLFIVRSYKLLLAVI